MRESLREIADQVPETPKAEAVISVKDLTKCFGEVTAVDHLSFDVRSGAVTGFLGQNGAGKSTTLRIILDLAAPTSGAASVLGSSYRELPDPTREVGAVLETASFNPLRSGRNHLRVIAAASGVSDERVKEVLDLVDLAPVAGRKVGKYSLGMRQRLGIAAALLGEPSVLILDEPANGLDPQGIRWLRGVLKDFADHGGTVLVSSHQLSEIQQMADEVIVIHLGKLVRQARVEDLVDGGATYLVSTPKLDLLSRKLASVGMQTTKIGESRIRVTGGSAELIGDTAFRAQVPLHELALEQTSLEDIFLSLTSEEEIR